MAGCQTEEMEVELDAAFMDGDTLDIGAVAAIKDYCKSSKYCKTIIKRKSEQFVSW